MIKPDVEEYFKTQSEFNQWLTQLTDQEKDHVVHMLSELVEVMAGDIVTVIELAEQDLFCLDVDSACSKLNNLKKSIS